MYESYTEKAYGAIVRMILEEKIVSGVRYSEADIISHISATQAVEVSRNPVRAAVAALRAQGVIGVVHAIGFYLIDPKPAEIHILFKTKIRMDTMVVNGEWGNKEVEFLEKHCLGPVAQAFKANDRAGFAIHTGKFWSVAAALAGYEQYSAQSRPMELTLCRFGIIPIMQEGEPLNLHYEFYHGVLSDLCTGDKREALQCLADRSRVFKENDRRYRKPLTVGPNGKPEGIVP